MSATCASSKPSIEDSSPVAAMMAPPGTPGAATMVMPSMKMKPAHCVTETSIPWVRQMAKAKAKIFEVDPARWIVAHSGTVKEATASDTPFFLVWASVTGMVAAEDEVPRAVR